MNIQDEAAFIREQEQLLAQWQQDGNFARQSPESIDIKAKKKASAASHTREARKPKAIHFTEGGPWFKDFQDVEYADLWIETANKTGVEWSPLDSRFY